MVVRAPRRFAQLLLAVCAFVACASGPRLARVVTVNEGETTRIRLLAGTSLVLSLQNESSIAAGALYGEARSAKELGAKVVDDVDLQALLDVFAERGMFPHSLVDVPADARDVLVVESGGQRWLWARRGLAGDPAAEQSFGDARTYFLALYNSSIAYHGAGPGKPNFGGENLRARSTAADARARLEQLRTGQR
jgi:hypothetical protein